jgi:GNAT superfamily N-acetyltransferase
MSDPIIRGSQPKDVDAIVAMLRELHGQHVAWDAARWTTNQPPHFAYQGWIAALAENRGDGVVFVAEVDGAVVGYVIAEVSKESPEHWTPRAVYLQDLYVGEPYRRLGIARLLMNAVLAWAKEAQPTLQLRLMTAAANEPARKFFAGVGFRPCVIEMIRESGR